MGFFNFGKKKQAAVTTSEPEKTIETVEEAKAEARVEEAKGEEAKAEVTDTATVEEAASAAATNSADDSEWIESFGHFPQLDENTGIEYCGGDPDFFKEMLEEFCNAGNEALIAEGFAKKDWNLYQINVHALKGTALTVGALRMHEVAKAIDAANKQSDIAFVEAHHEAMMEELQRTYDYLKAYIAQ